MKRPAHYVVQHYDGTTWRAVTQPQANRNIVHALAARLGAAYRVFNRYTGRESK